MSRTLDSRTPSHSPKPTSESIWEGPSSRYATYPKIRKRVSLEPQKTPPKTSGTFLLPASSAPPGRGGPAGKRKCRGIRRREHRALYEFLGFRRWVLYRMASVRHGPWYLIPPPMESLLSNLVPLWASLSPVQKGRPLLGLALSWRLW